MAADDPTGRYWTLDLTKAYAKADVDENGRPFLILDFGAHAVELSGGAHHAEAAAGARRIMDGLWDLAVLLGSRRLAEEGKKPTMPEPKTEPNGHRF